MKRTLFYVRLSTDGLFRVYNYSTDCMITVGNAEKVQEFLVDNAPNHPWLVSKGGSKDAAMLGESVGHLRLLD